MRKSTLPILLIAFLLAVSSNYLFAQPSPPSGQQWQLVFNDDFNTWNSNEWGRGSTPWGSENQSSCNLIPPGNTDTWVSDGILRLRSRYGSFTGESGTVYPYTSGWAWMQNWRTYGYIEIRAQFPDHRGAWPAFWMLGDGWPPEFDIAEYRGAPRNYMTRAFYDGEWHTQTMGGDYTGWHTYGLEWLPNRLRFYVNGNLRFEYNGPTPSEPMYVILSNGTDCNDGDGSGLPSFFNVDYVRWYQLDGSGGGGSSYVRLENRGTGLFIDGMGRSSNGSACGQWSGSGSQNQQWAIENAGSYVKLRNRATGLYLDGMGRTSNGSDAGQWGNSSSYNQQWAQESSGGYVKFRNRATDLYLDGMGRTSNGSNLGQWGNSSHVNQQWTLVNVSGRSAGAEADLENSPAELQLYPNPAEDRLNIDLPTDLADGKIAVFNSLGKLLMTKEATGKSIALDIAELKAGLYVIRATKANRMLTSRFTKL